jgi:uncharacterized membrane protein
MKNTVIKEHAAGDLEGLKRLTTAVYLCQALSFVLAGAPLLVGVILNFLNHDAVEGTWLQSHFDWQIKTVWLSLAGFALAGLTFRMGIGLYILIPTLAILGYRVYLGWTALIVDKPISDRN